MAKDFDSKTSWALMEVGDAADRLLRGTAIPADSYTVHQKENAAIDLPQKVARGARTTNRGSFRLDKRDALNLVRAPSGLPADRSTSGQGRRTLDTLLALCRLVIEIKPKSPASKWADILNRRLYEDVLPADPLTCDHENAWHQLVTLLAIYCTAMETKLNRSPSNWPDVLDYDFLQPDQDFESWLGEGPRRKRHQPVPEAKLLEKETDPAAGGAIARVDPEKPPLSVVIGKLGDPDPSACKLALNEMTAHGVDAALAALPAVNNLLNHPIASVRFSAWGRIGWFGVNALLFVPELVKLALAENHDIVQIAAATALASVDPDGEGVFWAAKDLANVSRLIELLPTGVGPMNLRRALLKKVSAMQHGPLSGFLRLRSEEIVAYVYGPCPHVDNPQSEDAKRWRDSNGKNIRNWREVGRLRSIQIKEGLYDVQIEHLDGLRKIYFTDCPRCK